MKLRTCGIALIAAAMSSGCFRAEAKTPGPPPALEIPEPPSRLVIPVTFEPPPTPTPSPTPTPTPRPTPPVSSGRGTPPPTGTPPVTTPPPSDPPPPPPVLQTNTNMAELERQANDRLDRADKDLAKIAGTPLSKNAQAQFDSAKRFAKQARDAINAKNFVYALYCADKAATLASLLLK